MELKEPKKKKRVKEELKSSLPLVFGSKGEITQFHANLTALGSCIANPAEMEVIYKMGYFGKGSLSKSYPQFGRIRFGAPPVIRSRQWQRRQNWIGEVQKLSIESIFDEEKQDRNKTKLDKKGDEIEESGSKDVNNTSDIYNSTCDSEILTPTECSSIHDKLVGDIEILDQEIKTNGQNMDVDEVVLDSTEEEEEDLSEDNLYFKNENIADSRKFDKNTSELQGKLLILPDSDSDTDNYLIDIKPEVRNENFPVRETLHLTFEETFFLMYGLGCLLVIDFDGKFLSIGETWEYFCKESIYFVQKYVVFHYFRSKGWIVKPGLKYGGDFLLYKEGPPFYHSSYIVLIDVLDSVTFKRIESKSLREMSYKRLTNLQRLAEANGKEVLFSQVLWPPSVPLDTTPASPEILSQFTVREILWRRWILNRDTFSSNVEEKDDDEDGYSS